MWHWLPWEMLFEACLDKPPFTHYSPTYQCDLRSFINLYLFCLHTMYSACLELTLEKNVINLTMLWSPQHDHVLCFSFMIHSCPWLRTTYVGTKCGETIFWKQWGIESNAPWQRQLTATCGHRLITSDCGFVCYFESTGPEKQFPPLWDSCKRPGQKSLVPFQ